MASFATSAAGAGVPIIKSHNDKRSYRYVTLKNNLHVTLVSDEETEKSSACVDVRVGSLMDPPEMPGLAHFLEHMLFLGTETYPVENAYSSYLNAHGGSSNAYTDQEDTVYYFDVLNTGFEEALNMFASFFVCPLFTESATARETNAVDSENQKNLQSDMWRHYQLLKSMARDGHPFRSFSTGNADTLLKGPEAAGKNPRDVVIEFYHKYYSSNIMKLVLYGKEDLDTLQKWAEEKFAAIPDKNLSPPRVPSDPYGPAQLGKVLEVVPVRDMKGLDLYFPIPPVEHLYLSKPLRCLSHLIGHESAGSILSALKARGQGWANGLSASVYASYTDFACFSVSIELTDEGVGHVDEIVGCVFAYVGMLLRKGPEDWIGQEYKEILNMNFRFAEKTEPAREATKLANNMQICAPEHTVCGPELIFSLDMAGSWKYLQYLTPANCMVAVKHKGFAGKTALKEKWYQTEYNERAFSPEQVQRWQACLDGRGGADTGDWANAVRLPLMNPFVPTEFSIRSAEEGSATKLPTFLDRIATTSGAVDGAEADDGAAPSAGAAADGKDGEEEDEEEEEEEEEGGATGALAPPPGKVLTSWFLQDATWKVPKANLLMAFEHLLAFSTPAGVALTDVFARCLKEVLNEYAYYADCAGLSYDVRVTKGGFELMFYGYHHKLPVLVQRVVDEMRRMASGDTPCPPELYARMKEKVLRQLYNTSFQQPYYHALLGTLSVMEEPRWNADEKFAALSAATLADFQSFSAQLLRCLKAEVLVHGNATAQEARALTAAVLETLKALPLPPSQEPIRRTVQLEAGTTYVYRQHCRQHNPKEPNSAVENYYLVGEIAGAEAAAAGAAADGEAAAFAGRICDEALLELLAHLISEPAFDQLRTKEQLGYIVFTTVMKSGHFMGLRMIVQSSHKDPVYLNQRVEEFLTGFHAHLQGLSAEDLATNIQAVVDKLTEKPKNLDQESGRHWEEVRGGWALFDRKDRVAAALKGATLPQCVAFFETHLRPGAPTRRKVSSQFFGKGTVLPKTPPTEEFAGHGKVVLVTDPAAFKRSMVLLPAKTYF